jgi:peptide/nickel transport system ATP-binding protein
MKTAHFNISIHSGNHVILKIDEFSFSENKITFLFGESGIGKSMISKTIYGLLDPEELDIIVNEIPYSDYCTRPAIRQLKENSFFVFQEPSSHLNPLLKLEDQLNEGSISENLNEDEILRHLWQSLDEQAIQSILDVYPKPYRPSGGEKQRILLAMAFKKINKYISETNNGVSTFVFDEPTGSLDNRFRNLFLSLLFKKFMIQPFTVLFITHDYSIISEIFNQYKSLVESIDFKELSRGQDQQLQVSAFSADKYLNWLKNLKYISVNKKYEEKSAAPVLHLKNDFVVFNRSYKIFNDPELQEETELIIHPGQLVYLKAGSGVGKTTLAKIIMGLIKAEKLKLKLCDMVLTEKTESSFWQKEIWGKRAGMVFQHADEAMNLQATVRESLEGLKSDRLKGEELFARLKELFDESIDEKFLNQKVLFLSGGQKQRLNLLRTLVLDVDLVILDEPLNGLDFESIQKILNWLNAKREQGKALLMISHNEEIFEHLIDEGNTYYLTFS